MSVYEAKMIQNSVKIVVGISGASGMIYSSRLLQKLVASANVASVMVVFSKNALSIWNDEIGSVEIFNHEKIVLFDIHDFFTPIASGSSLFHGMVICPASMGIIGRIASGASDCLITRAADVSLKERRKLIVVPRETPYNLIHLRNMEQITLSGGIVCPASPSFYSKPSDFYELADTVVDRIFDLLEIPINTFRWGSI